MNLKVIAKIENDFPTKFGLPRQSGLSKVQAKIVFEKEYGDENAFRGLEEFSHVGVLWGFSEVEDKEFSPTVRPPRLGGNKRMGVFATRAPYRPNPIGLSCVKLDKIEKRDGRVVLFITGADMMSGTPVYDVKPYIPHSDCVQATSGFSGKVLDYELEVEFSDSAKGALTKSDMESLREVLAQDPRPSYKEDGDKRYGFLWKDKEIKFRVIEGVLTVLEVEVVR